MLIVALETIRDHAYSDFGHNLMVATDQGDHYLDDYINMVLNSA